jgi:hypothetical protein
VLIFRLFGWLIASTIAGSRCECVLIHRQLPIGSNFVITKYIQLAVAPPDLEVAIVGAMPLIDVLADLDLPVVETNSSELFDAAFIHIGLYPDLHGLKETFPASDAVAVTEPAPEPSIGLV